MIHMIVFTDFVTHIPFVTAVLKTIEEANSGFNETERLNET